MTQTKLAAFSFLLGILFVSSMVFSDAIGVPIPPDRIKDELTLLRLSVDSPTRKAQEARLLFFQARLEPSLREDERLNLYEEGKNLSLKAREVEPENPAALFWWSANTGGIAKIKRSLSALRSLKEIEKVLTQLREKSPEYGFAAADRLLGTIYHEAPGFISIGSDRKSRECLERAIQAFPDFPGNQLAYAKFLIDEGEKERAAKILEALSASPTYLKNDFGEFSIEKNEWEDAIRELRAKASGGKT